MSDKRTLIFTPEEIQQQDKKNNLLEAIGEFQILAISFSNPESLDYYPIETLFKINCEKQKKIDPTFDIDVFAVSEKERIEGVIERVKFLSDKTYYSEHPTFIQALKYIKFLGEFQHKEPKHENPVVEFADYLKHQDPEAFAAKIKKEFPSILNSGRDSAALYQALEKSERMKYVPSNKAIFNAMTEYFGNIGNMKGFNSYLNCNSKNYNNLKTSGIIEKFIDILNRL